MSGKILYDDGEFKIIDCQDSGFVRVFNPPTDKRLDEIYENEYYSNDKPDIIESYYKDIELKNDGTEKNLTHIYLGEVLEHIKKPKSFL